MPPVLTATSLVRSYGKVRAVAGIDLTVSPKEIYGLLGPNGSGKTTTLSMLAGVLRPDSGTVRLDGVSIAQSSARLRLGFVPQEIALYPQLTTTENLVFFGRMQGMRGAALRAGVTAALETVNLTAHAGRPVDKLSSGMRRRANIAVALVHAPDVLIMDEPTVGVDPQSRNAILDQIAALACAGRAVVFASHYMEEVQRLCGRIGIIDAGTILAEGTVRDLLAKSSSRSRIVLTAVPDAEEALRSLILGLTSEAVFDSTAREFHIPSTAPAETLTRLLGIAGAAHVPIQRVQLVQPTLEDVFLELTGKALRE